MQTAPLDSSRLKTVGWAAFLGASWTWVIGMYLPVLLVREFGLWGWIVFALPNVIGAAAMGAVMLNAERSRKLLGQHAAMATAFSIVTVAFHVFFVGWLLVGMVGLSHAVWAFLLAAMFFAVGGRGRDLVLGVFALIVSAVCMGFVLTQPLENSRLLWTADPRPELLALTPVCIFGFFLCPYLDLTFHRARQATEPKAGIRAFQIGFGVFFFAMIVFTLLYARWLGQGLHGGADERLLARVIGVHLITQSAFTLAIHVRSVLAAGKDVHFARPALVLAAVVAIGLAALAQQQLLAGRFFRHLDVGEVIYRCFMGFYGLLFPAYVWLCMIPKGPPAAPNRGRWIRFAIAVAGALPFFWLGFVERQYWWLLAGLGVVVGMRWTVREETPKPGDRNPKSEIRMNDE